MTEFTHRNSSVASGPNAAERVSAVRAVTPVGQAGLRADASSDPSGQRPVAQVDAAVQSGEATARTFADYAKVNRDIANVVDSVGGPSSGGGGQAGLAQAENALLSLLPQPSVVLPLPPADKDMVAFVAQVSQSIARQAAQTRAAMSGVAPAIVDAATAA